jgi:type IX secretion system PorP/SprF family membrane protein
MKNLSTLSRAKYMVMLLFACVCGNRVMAQQEAQYSQYMFNMLAVNPAYAGSRDVLSMTGLYRQQWVGITGAPTTETFTIDLPIRREKVGIGLNAYNDKIGPFQNTGVYAAYSYRVKVSQRATLAMGIQGGVTNLLGDLTGIRRTIGGNDVDAAFSQNISKLLPNVGTGLYLSTDRGYLGISCPMLIQNVYTATGKDDTSSVQKARQYRHYFAMMGFVVGLSNSLKLKPSVLVKMGTDKGVSAAVDFNLNLWIKDRVAVGASWRTNNNNFNNSVFANQNGDAVIGMLELQLSDQLKLGYAYDFALNGLQNRQQGTHEVMLRYEFGYRKAKILTPRYF